jgi:thiosulfate/3-mercaptopyruvate sulfurtransferase
MSNINERGYTNPEVLVSTDWVAQHLNDPAVRLIESNEDSLLYAAGHIPGAVQVDWTTDLNDPLRRDYLRREGFEALMSRIGVTPDTTVVFYGDKNNWWATYAFWVFQLFGHTKAKIVDGGRLKWEKEGRSFTKDRPQYAATKYKAPERDMPEYPNEGALRGGHIPGAKNVPWARAANPEDGTFKTAEQLRAIYMQEAGLKPNDEVIAYCRIGERSSHTWFVLTHLLGFKNVRNDDGSWTEWGNLVNVPIER